AWSVAALRGAFHVGDACRPDLPAARQPAVADRRAVAGAAVPHLQRAGLGLWHCGLHHHGVRRSEEHTSELQSHSDLVCRLLLDNKIAWLHIELEVYRAPAVERIGAYTVSA